MRRSVRRIPELCPKYVVTIVSKELLEQLNGSGMDAQREDNGSWTASCQKAGEVETTNGYTVSARFHITTFFQGGHLEEIDTMWAR